MIDAKLDEAFLLSYALTGCASITGNFAGFLIGISASSLVSQFFESVLKEPRGMGREETLVDKDTFSNLEGIISIVIGFIAFEIMTKVVKEKINRHFPAFRFQLLRSVLRNNWHVRLKGCQVNVRKRYLIFLPVCRRR